MSKLMSYAILLIASVFPSVSFADEIKCLAETIYHEARGGTDAQRSGPAFVVMKRLKDSRFPKSICGITRQKHPVVQFPWSQNKKEIKELSVWEECVELAKRIYNGQIEDPTRGALFFHAKGANIKWKNLRKIYDDGLHIYYTNK